VGARTRTAAGFAAVAIATLLTTGCSTPTPQPADITGTWTYSTSSSAGRPGGVITFRSDGTFEASDVPSALLGQDGFLEASWDATADTTGTWAIAAAGAVPGTDPPAVATSVPNSAGAHSHAELYVSGSGSKMHLWTWVDIDAATTYELRRSPADRR